MNKTIILRQVYDFDYLGNVMCKYEKYIDRKMERYNKITGAT